jgi:dTDP-4-dehydrorhamnose reductase
MTFLITGANGMLGQDLQRVLSGRRVTALGRDDLDITDRDIVEAAVAGHSAVINCAAYTRVDDAEDHEDVAFAVNATGAGYLAEAAARHSAKLIQLSTDYVFDGAATSPYPVDAVRNPVSAYGRTKAEGERLALALNPDGTCIVRTAWLYGANGPNFAKTMVRLAASHETLTVVDDQHGQPTWTLDLARQIVAMLDADVPPGVYHATNSGNTTWFEFAREIFRQTGLDPLRVHPIPSTEFPRPAPRPAYSVLGHEEWRTVGLAPMRAWTEALSEAVAEGVLLPS